MDGRVLVQFVADIRIRINFHTFLVGCIVYDTCENKSTDKNNQSKSDIIQIGSGG